MGVSMGVTLSQCACQSQRTASSVNPHLPPSLRQGQFAIELVIYLAGLRASGDSFLFHCGGLMLLNRDAT